jgi:hypothetical protein
MIDAGGLVIPTVVLLFTVARKGLMSVQRIQYFHIQHHTGTTTDTHTHTHTHTHTDIISQRLNSDPFLPSKRTAPLEVDPSDDEES